MSSAKNLGIIFDHNLNFQTHLKAQKHWKHSDQVLLYRYLKVPTHLCFLILLYSNLISIFHEEAIAVARFGCIIFTINFITSKTNITPNGECLPPGPLIISCTITEAMQNCIIIPWQLSGLQALAVHKLKSCFVLFFFSFPEPFFLWPKFCILGYNSWTHCVSLW